ncbi:MAG: hypothetical protein ACOYNC_19765 [Bacteroidales bacterium]
MDKDIVNILIGIGVLFVSVTASIATVFAFLRSEKNYIGKGTMVANLSIVKFSFKLSEIAKLSHVFNGEDYITFEVAKLKNTDSFGHGYTAYVNKMVETPEPQASLVEDAPKKSTRKPKRTATPKTEASIFPDNTDYHMPESTDELPF